MDIEQFMGKWRGRCSEPFDVEDMRPLAETVLEAIKNGADQAQATKIVNVHHHYVLSSYHTVSAVKDVLRIEPHHAYMLGEGLITQAMAEAALKIAPGTLNGLMGAEDKQQHVGSIDLATEALAHYAEQMCEGWCGRDNSQAVWHNDDCAGCAARRALLRMTHGAVISTKPSGNVPENRKLGGYDRIVGEVDVSSGDATSGSGGAGASGSAR